MNYISFSTYLLAAGGGTNDQVLSDLASRLGQNAQSIFKDPVGYFENHALEYLGFLAVMVVGYFLSRWMGEFSTRALDRQGMEPPVRNLLVRLMKLVIFCTSLMVALSIVGFPITPLIAGLTGLGVGVGLGLQGFISNLAAGLTIIFTKPFRVGEYIQIFGVEGMVTQIELLSTTLDHNDGSLVFIPNHKIQGEILQNYGMTRQLNLAVGVGYATDIAKAETIIKNVLAANPRVLKSPAPLITIQNLGDSAITISVKPWVKLADINPAQLELNAAIVAQFQANKIEIPFPQREVHVLKNESTGRLEPGGAA